VERFEEATANTDAREVPYREEMERAFGEDFSKVDAHVGAGETLDAMGARAAAMGEKVAFSEASPAKDVVAHELAHVIQARQSGVDSAVQTKATHDQPHHAAEVEADHVADAVTHGEQAQVSEAPGAAVQFSFWGAVSATLGLDDKTPEGKDAAAAEPKQGAGAKEFLASLETWVGGMSAVDAGQVYVKWLDEVLRGHPGQLAHLKSGFNITGLTGQYRIYAFQVARALFHAMGRNNFVSLYRAQYRQVGSDAHNLLRSHLKELCDLDHEFGAWVYLDMFPSDQAEATAVMEGQMAFDRIAVAGQGQDKKQGGGGGGYQ
jgi:hypothetical protein